MVKLNYDESRDKNIMLLFHNDEVIDHSYQMMLLDENSGFWPQL